MSKQKKAPIDYLFLENWKIERERPPDETLSEREKHLAAVCAYLASLSQKIPQVVFEYDLNLLSANDKKLLSALVKMTDYSLDMTETNTEALFSSFMRSLRAQFGLIGFLYDEVYDTQDLSEEGEFDEIQQLLHPLEDDWPRMTAYAKFAQKDRVGFYSWTNEAIKRGTSASVIVSRTVASAFFLMVALFGAAIDVFFAACVLAFAIQTIMSPLTIMTVFSAAAIILLSGLIGLGLLLSAAYVFEGVRTALDVAVKITANIFPRLKDFLLPHYERLSKQQRKSHPWGMLNNDLKYRFSEFPEEGNSESDLLEAKTPIACAANQASFFYRKFKRTTKNMRQYTDKRSKQEEKENGPAVVAKASSIHTKTQPLLADCLTRQHYCC